MNSHRITKKYRFTDPTEISPMNVRSLEKNKKEIICEESRKNIEKSTNKVNSNDIRNESGKNNLLSKIKNSINNIFNINFEIDDIILIGLLIIFLLERNNPDNENKNDIDTIMLALVYLLL